MSNELQEVKCSFGFHDWGEWFLAETRYSNMLGWQSGDVEVRARRCKKCLKTRVKRLNH